MRLLVKVLDLFVMVTAELQFLGPAILMELTCSSVNTHTALQRKTEIVVRLLLTCRLS